MKYSDTFNFYVLLFIFNQPYIALQLSFKICDHTYCMYNALCSMHNKYVIKTFGQSSYSVNCNINDAKYLVKRQFSSEKKIDSLYFQISSAVKNRNINKQFDILFIIRATTNWHLLFIILVIGYRYLSIQKVECKCVVTD